MKKYPDQKTGKAGPPSCDWDASSAPGADEGKPRDLSDRFHAYKGEGVWEGVATEEYKDSDGTFLGVLRRTLVGAKGEQTRFHVRYFEIAPGGHTTCERHEHEHVVISVRGSGEALTEGKIQRVSPWDVLYIAPSHVHQLRNPGGEPFGFLCIVDAERDRPVPVPDEEE